MLMYWVRPKVKHLFLVLLAIEFTFSVMIDTLTFSLAAVFCVSCDVHILRCSVCFEIFCHILKKRVFSC